MGFSDHNVSLIPDSYLNSRSKDDEKDNSAIDNNNGSTKLSDQEILETTEAIYFTENVDTGVYELRVRTFAICELLPNSRSWANLS